MKENIASFKYTGKAVELAILDAKSASQALMGIDKSMKYFIGQDRPDIAALDLPIPVRIREGSWEALIPTGIIDWIMAVGGVVTTGYLATAASELAKNDCKEKGLKDVIAGAVKSIQWFLKIGKHLGHLAVKNLTGLLWDREDMVGLINQFGEVLYVPVAIFKKILECPKNILNELAAVVEIERSLEVVVFEESGEIGVRLERNERHIFFEEKDEGEELFPELAHGMECELRGIVTRGNEMSNTIGFYYNGHILTCVPKRGSIVRWKRHLFLECLIRGTVSRLNKDKIPISNRPKIMFDELVILRDEEQIPLDLDSSDEEA